MKKLFFVLCIFCTLGSWAQSQTEIQILESQKTDQFTITTWAGESLNFVIFDGCFWIQNADSSYSLLDSFRPKEVAVPIIIAKPPYERYANKCEKSESYLICVYRSKDGSIFESYFDIGQREIVAVAAY